MEPLYLEASRFLAIGDVHGCYYTFRDLVEKHWNPEREVLVQLGDLINRGPHSYSCIRYARELKAAHPDRVYFIMGNHEFDLQQYLMGKPHLKWVRSGGGELVQSMFDSNDYSDFKDHLDTLYTCVETPTVLLSHAGRPEGTDERTPPHSPIGVFYNRQPLADLGKTQVIGHVPCKSGIAEFRKKSQSWRIDTGAYLGRALTGVKISKKGVIKDVIRVETLKKDKNPTYSLT